MLALTSLFASVASIDTPRCTDQSHNFLTRSSICLFRRQCRLVLPSKANRDVVTSYRLITTIFQPLSTTRTPRSLPATKPRVGLRRQTSATHRAHSSQLAFVTMEGNNQPTKYHGLVRP